jgi:tetratricopeptide (TPR) repeat protein
VGACLWVLLLAAAARANEGREAAREHFRKGTTHYVLNHYEAAIAEFEAGYAAEPEPAFLYNLAQAHAKLGHLKIAIDFYRKYLELGPTEQDVAPVQETIDRLTRELEAPKAPPAVAPPPAVSPVVAPSPEPPGRGWRIGAGIAAAVIVIGVVVGLAVGLSQPHEPSIYWSVR